jgi:hypothetical protein
VYAASIPLTFRLPLSRAELIQSGLWANFLVILLLSDTKTSIVTPLFSQVSTNPNINVAVLLFQHIHSNSYCILSIHKYPTIQTSTWLYSPSNTSDLTPIAYSLFTSIHQSQHLRGCTPLPTNLFYSNSYCILSIHKYPPIPISTWLYSPSNTSVPTPTAHSLITSIHEY